MIIGTLFAIIGSLVSLVIGEMDKAHIIIGGIGFFFIGISMILSGSLVSGDKVRENYATESEEDRAKRTQTTFRTALIAFPNLLVALFLYLLYK